MNGQQRKEQAFELKVRELLGLGLTVSAIAKRTNRTYRHTANIAARIRAEVGPNEGTFNAQHL